MVLTNPPATPPTTTTSSPDSENDTPPRSQPIRQFPFTNGTAAKSHHLPYPHHHQQPPPYASVTYRECLKNHAVNSGGHALDGCGEFMPSASVTTNDPASLTCAACGCHRNFHRQETDEYTSHRYVPSMAPHFIDFRKPGRPALSPSPPPPPKHSVILSYPPAPEVRLALSPTAYDDPQVPNHQFTVATPLTPRNARSFENNLSGRKRFRTKFTQQQKEKMHSLAESLGWKMQRCNQTLVENFCKEIGVARRVLKVWMHNNKNTFNNKKESSITGNSIRNAAAANDDDDHVSAENNGGISPPGSSGYNMNSSINDDGDEDNNNESGDHNMTNGIGSSPSS